MDNINNGGGDSVIISSDRLKVTYRKPGTYYRGARFDWTGFITQVELDGTHKFCVPESLKPGHGTGGAGLCNEFGIEVAIGYDEARPGERFPKLGVGLLRKEDSSPYYFPVPYDIEPFPFKVFSSESSIEVIAEPVDSNGYSARLRKVFAVQGDRLIMDYCLENTGKKPIRTHEYCHNFIGIDGHSVGPDYSLKFSFDVELMDIPEAEGLEAKGNTITWTGIPQKDFYNKPKGFAAGKPHTWELIHMPSGVGLREYSKLPVSEVALWGHTHVVSPEMFIDISVLPGEACEWAREYEFFCIK